MNSPIRPALSAAQHHTLAVALHDDQPGTRIRAAAIRHWYAGHSGADAAARAHVSPTTIRRWVREFATTGTIPAGRSQVPSPPLHPPRGSVITPAARQFLATLGDELRSARTRREWSRTKAVAACGVNFGPALLGHWERGDRALPLVAFAILCRAWEIDPGQVIQRCYDKAFKHVRELP